MSSKKVLPPEVCVIRKEEAMNEIITVLLLFVILKLIGEKKD